MQPNDLLTGDLRIGVEHRVRFCRAALEATSGTTPPIVEELARLPRTATGFRPRMLPVVDGGFAAANPDFAARLRRTIESAGSAMPAIDEPLVVPGGEGSKSDPAVLESILNALDRGRICRQSVVLAIGGGAVLDVVGYAAAIFHRGVRLLRMPTTTLAQDDAAMGVKNGINHRGKKNLLGTFAVPTSVLCDLDLLGTLADRDWRSGFAEAVKIAVIRDEALFARLERDAKAIRERDRSASEPVIRRSAELHYRHILEGGDPFELGTARPLDFGHWAAHRLESMSNHRLRHGEAVAIGVALDSTIAMLDGRIDETTQRRIVATLLELGLPITAPELDDLDGLMQGVEEFREHLGGVATVAMPIRLGASAEVQPPGREEVAAAIAILQR